MELARFNAILESARGRGVAVVGDLMLDRYIWGTATRISPEAPVPVVAVDRVTAAPGGAANVLRNLARLGVAAHPFGIVGRDAGGDELATLLQTFCAASAGILRTERKTTEKTRLFAGSQQVARIDNEDIRPIDDTSAQELLTKLRGACADGSVSAIIVEDYAKGCVTKPLLDAVVRLGREHNLPVTMDPHPSNAWEVEGLSVLTPNRSEAFALAGAYYSDGAARTADDTPLHEVARNLFERWKPERLLVTLGARGMALYEAGELRFHIPTYAREVYDVSGAGDTVIAALTVAMIGGAAFREAAEIANHAASVVVGKVGTAPVELAELRAALSSSTSH